MCRCAGCSSAVHKYRWCGRQGILLYHEPLVPLTPQVRLLCKLTAPACTMTSCNPASADIASALTLLALSAALRSEQVAAETLKAALLATTTAAAVSEGAQASLMQLLVPLLIEAAAPAGTRTPALADMALKLITHLASGPAAPAFKAVVAGLPVGTKQRLQQALQGGAAAAPSPAVGAPAATATSAKPSIALKSFAAFKPPQ